MNTKLSRYLLAVCLLGMTWAASAAGPADFTLPDLQGQEHRLSDYRGKWVLVNYWATWCPPCREELPELEIFHSQAHGSAVVLGVNMEAIDHSELEAFVEDQFLSYPILVAGPNPGPGQRIGLVTGLPTSYLISPEGKVVARQVGPVTADAIRSFIDTYNKQNKRG